MNEHHKKQIELLERLKRRGSPQEAALFGWRIIPAK
jgi:hypothetical protein